MKNPTNNPNRPGSDRRRRVRRIATALALTGLAGGVAFALWSAEAQFAGGSITAGDLALEAQGQPKYWDVSPDRKDATQLITSNLSAPKGHGIDPAQWRIVPGDTVAIVRQARIALDGDNLTAALAVSGLDGTGELPMDLAFGVYDTVWGTTYGSGTITPDSNGRAELTYFTAGPIGTDYAPGKAGSDENAKVHMLEGPDAGVGGGEAFVDIIIYANFDAATTNRDYTDAAASLAGLKLELNQVRDTGTQFK